MHVQTYVLEMQKHSRFEEELAVQLSCHSWGNTCKGAGLKA